MEITKCQKCGRPLDKDDKEFCKACIGDEHGKFENIIVQPKAKNEGKYTNDVANDFKSWSSLVNGIGIIVAIVIIIYAISNSTEITMILIAIMGYAFFKAISLFLLAVAEIIQKLHNIEENTRC